MAANHVCPESRRVRFSMPAGWPAAAPQRESSHFPIATWGCCFLLCLPVVPVVWRSIAFTSTGRAPMAAKKKAAKKSAKKSAKRPAKKTAKKSARKATKRTPNAAFMKAMTPSSTLAAVVGICPLPRTQVTKKLWAYINRKGLQDKKNRRMINADAKLRPIFKKDQVSMFEMTKLVSRHLS